MMFFQILNFSFHVSVVFYCFPFKRLLVADPLNSSLNIFPFNFKFNLSVSLPSYEDTSSRPLCSEPFLAKSRWGLGG